MTTKELVESLNELLVNWKDDETELANMVDKDRIKDIRGIKLSIAQHMLDELRIWHEHHITLIRGGMKPTIAADYDYIYGGQ